MKLPFSKKELEDRIKANRDRLSKPYYQIDQVFMPADYDWQGDKEGRALLAFSCHAKMGSEPIACMEQMIKALPDHLNAYGYFGRTESEIIDEQQLSGHSWYLRGLCSYYELCGSEYALSLIKSTVSHLYLPLIGRVASYPTEQQRQAGGVSGHAGDVFGGWRLSSDVGCAFMAIDGLSHAYEITRDENTLTLLREMIAVFDGIDKLAIRAQTHCSLSAARGMLRLYRLLNEKYFLFCAKKIADLYLEKGMTLTDQNLNWWGRPDSWTEPCAIVDSLILFAGLYEATCDIVYKLSAIRVAHNGFATLQRDHGGAGCETVVLHAADPYAMHLEEAPFCCTMRLAEGLLYLKEHTEFFTARLADSITKEGERLMLGDLLTVRLTSEIEPYADLALKAEWEGIVRVPIPKYYKIPAQTAKSLVLRLD